MKKILVPIDFSPASKNASEYAALLSKAVGAPMQLLHVYLAPVQVTEPPITWSSTVGPELQEENYKLVQEEIRFLKEKYAVDVSGEAWTGIKGDAINVRAKESDAGLVVMGMKKDKGQRFLRSTVFSAIRKVSIPILVVPEEACFKPIKDIVLAVDFDGVRDTSCFDPLFMLLDTFKATLQVLHVAGKEAAVKAEELPGKLQLGRILSKVTYWYHELDEDNVEQSILKFVENHPADLLVMVAHRHSFYERFFGAVHTRSISAQTSIPLLILEDKAG